MQLDGNFHALGQLLVVNLPRRNRVYWPNRVPHACFLGLFTKLVTCKLLSDWKMPFSVVECRASFVCFVLFSHVSILELLADTALPIGRHSDAGPNLSHKNGSCWQQAELCPSNRLDQLASGPRLVPIKGHAWSQKPTKLQRWKTANESAWTCMKGLVTCSQCVLNWGSLGQVRSWNHLAVSNKTQIHTVPYK